jgi:hypothetical protein
LDAWPQLRLELRDQLVEVGRIDVWELIETYMPEGVASEYHVSILMQRVDERLGGSGIDALLAALDRVQEANEG